MIIGSELRDWAADRERQRRARIAADAFATRWDNGPAHRGFTEAMAALPERTAEAVADAVLALFADDSWAEALLAALCEEMARDPFFEPPFRHINSDIHSGLIVFEDDNVSIAAGVVGIAQLAAKKNFARAATSIVFSGQVGVFKFVRAGGARISFWEAPRIDENFSASLAGRCRQTGEREITDGEMLVVDGRFESFVIAHAAANQLVLQATVKPDQAPLSVEYDSVSHEYVGCAAADDSASRIQMITTLLRKLDCAAAFPAVAAFLDHRDFFVRWHVMRELLGLDPETALPLLERMALSDPHPEVRRAAAAVLARVKGPQAGLRKAA